MEFKTYQEVYDFIAAQKQRVYSLDNFRRYMNDLNNPQYQLKCIHVGGTNGKGSTTNYIKEVLKVAGYKVGTFTSPPLYSRLDIIRINDVFIDEKRMIAYANKYMDTWLTYQLSMFEIEAFIAIRYFIDEKVDYAIFEVGLGGRLDATNIIKPLVAINTNIGKDHMEYLGNTYQSIAREKAGIIKDEIDFITGETKKECLDVFQEICHEHHATMYQVQDIKHIKQEKTIFYQYRDMDITLDASAFYQVQNSALALETLLYLRDKQYISCNDQQIKQGLFQAKWAGRFETVWKDPLIIIDGAHNKEGMEAFYQSAKNYSNIKIIFSAFKDKDSHSMIEYLLRLTDDITICEFEHVRSQKAKILAEDFPVKIQVDYQKAIDEVFLHQGVVFITGSLYFISLVRSYIKKKEETTF